ncbi:MAG: Ig-like domain-containing protein, partial [Anaerolineales bacterium]|nr:Ig-like domain-containing protein [Anaerolineales bacterium]
MKQKTRKTVGQSSLLFIASASLLILSLILSALPVSNGLAAPSDPGGMSLLGDAQPMGSLGEGSLCVNHTWVDITSYQVRGTIGSTSKQFYTARAKLTFPGGVVKYAFCTDINFTVGSNESYCLDPGFYSDWRIAWLVNNYPPVEDKELNAARQAAIWHFSDGFNLDQSDPTTADSTTDNKVKTHYNNILASIPSQIPPEYEAGNVNITITPQNATNFLPGQEAHPFTVTLTKGSVPLKGKTINVSTTFGTLNQTSGVTDDNGQVTFTVTSNAAGSATLTATATVLIPAGSRFIHQSSPTTK